MIRPAKIAAIKFNYQRRSRSAAHLYTPLESLVHRASSVVEEVHLLNIIDRHIIALFLVELAESTRRYSGVLQHTKPRLSHCEEALKKIFVLWAILVQSLDTTLGMLCCCVVFEQSLDGGRESWSCWNEDKRSQGQTPAKISTGP